MIEAISDFTIKPLGKLKTDVYDLETENHMFFANDILVHNSNYVDLTDILNRFYKIKPDADRNKATDFLDKVCKDIENNALNPLFEKMKRECNCHKDGHMHMDREAICVPYKKTGYSGLWYGKKRYYLCVSDMEDYRYPEPHPKIMGLVSITSTMPAFIKPIYNGVIQALIEHGEDEARKIIKNFKKEFFKMNVSKIAFQTSVSDVTRYVDEKTGLPVEGEWFDSYLNKKRNGGVPVNSSAAIRYNYLIKKLNLEKKYETIKNGTKIKWVYLLDNPYHFNAIAFIDNLPPEFELDEYVDIYTHYDKLFYKPISDIFNACHIDIEGKPSIDSFF